MYSVPNIKGKRYFINQMCAPQQGHPGEEKEMLEDNIDLNADIVTIIMGDFDAGEGQNRRGTQDITGRSGEVKNAEGENLIDLCKGNKDYE